MEYCDNLIFRRRAAVDEMTQRLLDANRTIGQPKKITMIFGRKVTKQYKGKLQTVIEDLDLPNPVIRSHYGHGFAKQYVRDGRILRTEPATNNVYDYRVKKDVENLPALQQAMSGIVDNYQNVQQDILETFVDRGQLRELAEPTVLANGKRIPGLKLDHPRQLALMQALVRFSNVAGGGTFRTADLYAPTLEALGCSESQYSLASLRYDLSKLGAKKARRESSENATVSSDREGLLDLCGVSETVREDLRSSHGRITEAFSRRSQTSRREAYSTRPALSKRQRRSRPDTEGCRAKDRRITEPQREQNSRC